MWKAVSSSDAATPYFHEIMAQVGAAGAFFALDQPVVVARAPGRLDVMGGIADYSGALVLELPLADATIVAVQRTADPLFAVCSPTMRDLASEAEVVVPMAELTPRDGVPAYATIRERLSAAAASSWVAYVAGALAVLQRERGMEFDSGFRVLVHSTVPVGKGVSSSAALEVAAMQAITASIGVALPGRELALLCQKVENIVVGAPCGIMDQMTSACGETGQLLALLCQPAELQPPVLLPPDIEVWGIDSGIRHAVSGADYGSVRTGAFMGYRIAADVAGLPVEAVGSGRVSVDDCRWHGHLANIPPSLWETTLRDRVPARMKGAEFLSRYRGLTDTVTTVTPEREYAVRLPAAHPIYEHHRVRLFRALLQSSTLTNETLELLGELMYASHASYTACGLGSDGTDRLVEMVREAGPGSGLYGAKITGGGSGGTVAVLARAGRKAAVHALASQYAADTGYESTVLGGSSPGAVKFGVVRLAPG